MALVPIPEYGDLMTIEQFKQMAEDGSLMDCDGHGKYANEKFMSTEYVYPSDVTHGKLLEGWTHIVWFNK